MKEDQIVIYKDENNAIQMEVRMAGEMIWLNRQQLATLFGRDYKTISKHINNALKEELANEVVVAKFANTTEHGAMEGKTQTHEKEYFNLEMVTSVGYRVKSKRGVQFRKWANKVLREYLVKGYVVNERIRKEQLGELRQLVRVASRAISNQIIEKTVESQDLLNVVVDYTYALDTLDNYDYERLTIDKTTKQEKFHATYDNAMEEIGRLRDKFGGSALFGNEKDDSFKSSIGQIYQTFGGDELYPSVEEKAAMLLYLVTKNHSFSDGNKRIAATLFLWFLNNNSILYREDGSKRLADNTLVALTLMIAESKTEEKDVMVKVVVNLINQRNE
jgi:prophage maintenance system killer protein